MLTSIALIAGVALSGVYALTKGTIEEQHRAAEAASYKVVLPTAESFEADAALDQAVADLNGQVYGSGFGRSYINEIFIGRDAAGEIAGYAISATSADGFDGSITLAVGVSPDGTLNGISFTELNETPGMGMRADEPEFKDQFNGRTATRFKLIKAGSAIAEDEIDSVSGASITSNAVVNAVNAALDFFHTTVKGGN
ncbi:MAG: RnfABCDGE type electron transport complex subunit G [Clostridia bacterium]|nr:RnfABCDGE type electron transport complex subunit G [Clostridia bacterium]